MKKRNLKSISFFVLLFFFISLLSIAKEKAGPDTNIPVDLWLQLGPFSNPLPAFHDSTTKGYTVEDLLKFDEIDIQHLKPQKNAPQPWSKEALPQWKSSQAGKEGIKLVPVSHTPATAYLATYLDVNRWTEAELSVKSPQLFRIYLDGKLISTKSKVDKNTKKGKSSKGRTLTADIKLETGKHLLVVKTAYDPDSQSDWTIKASLSLSEKFKSSLPLITLSAKSRMAISHLLDGPKVTDISISPGGTLAALTIRQSLPPTDSSETWIELHRLKEHKKLHTFRGGESLEGLIWAPTGQKFSYTTRSQSEVTLWVTDIETGSTTPILKNIKNMGNHTWAPDSSFIVYSVSTEGKSDRKGVKRVKNMADRQEKWRDRDYLYKVDLKSGTRQRLTAGILTTTLNSISPDSQKLLFTREFFDYAECPFFKTDLFSLDLQTLEVTALWKGLSWFESAQWIPQINKILILAGPPLFGDTGIDVPKGSIPNYYDTQAFLFDPKSRTVEPITKHFDPSINQAIWSESENCLYFTAKDRSFVHLFRYDINDRTFSLVESGVEFIHRFDVAKKIPVSVFLGSSASVPPRIYVLDLKGLQTRVLQDPGQSDFENVKFGAVERWTFENKNGNEIEGRVYYPPDFDAKKKYPCIVYYYGGVFPVARSFGGRYPFNLYAAQGYIVYILQPSGAVGFGQSFSALHVNDWGTIVAEEIITGVKEFLKAHPYVNASRVGCIGASYGGFMTMLLQTRTDMFSAAVAHAGISSISSYWGQGYWGYFYIAETTPNSFPWNRKDIFVDQSPLFNADKISTPLLLLHGSADTNVPPAESTQLFTALKLLGSEVEYIQIHDQNHHILAYNQRILWTKTILAWFDRWLKKEPEWWFDLYPAE